MSPMHLYAHAYLACYRCFAWFCMACVAALHAYSQYDKLLFTIYYKYSINKMSTIIQYNYPSLLQPQCGLNNITNTSQFVYVLTFTVHDDVKTIINHSQNP